MEPAASPGPQPRCITLFDLLAWLVAAASVAAAGSAGWQMGGPWGLAAGVVLGVVTIPVALLVGYLLTFAFFAATVYLFSIDRDFLELARENEATGLPAPRRGVDPRPFVLVFAIGVLWAVYGWPMIRDAHSSKEIKEAIMVAGLLPASAIAFASRRLFVALARRWKPSGKPSSPSPPGSPAA